MRARIGWIVVCLIAVCAVLAAGVLGGAAESTVPRVKTVLSDTYTVDRLYRSMMGPYSQRKVSLLETESPELIWITGYKATMVGVDGSSAMPQEFMCHSNLDIDVLAHRQALGVSTSFSSRLFTLSQGQFAIRFPEGFGIPVLSSQPLDLTTQVLNLNEPEGSRAVRHKVAIDFVRDRDLQRPLQALFPIGAYGLALLEGEDGYFGVADPDEEMHGPGCLVEESASDHAYQDGQGRQFTGHWVVKPGRQVNRTLVTHLMRLPYDTHIHYIAVHLHPFAESLVLRDLTRDETVFESQARNFTDRIGLAHVEAFSSAEGLPVYRDHEYELISTYHNTTQEDQDSMAVMYIYLRDLDFDPQKARAAVRERSSAVGG